MKVRLTRRVRFEAAHRLVSPQLSDAENEAVYGKCARPGGHGHNYEVEVTLDDGSQVDVQLDEEFNVVGTEQDGPGDD